MPVPGMYPSIWTSSEELHRLIVAPLSDLLARAVALQEQAPPSRFLYHAQPRATCSTPNKPNSLVPLGE